MRICVTAEDIAEGQPGEMCACPVARAVGRAVAEDRTHDGITTDPVWRDAPRVQAHVGGWGVSTCWRDGVMRYAQLPVRAYHFIRAYDDGDPVEPFEFDVEWMTREELDAHLQA